MRKSFLAAFAATSLISVSVASAADMPVRTYTKAPPLAPAFSWTGLYIGGNIGYGWTSGSGTLTAGGLTGPYSGSGDGFLGGGQIGYNWQAPASPWVFGLEADFQGSAGSGTVTGTTAARTITGTAKAPWFDTFRGRIGYAWNRSMVYATGGGLYGRATYSGVDSVAGPFSVSTNYWTYTVGAGLETFLWDRWSAKIEYLYAGTPNKSPTPPAVTALTGSSDTHVVRVGLNYHF